METKREMPLSEALEEIIAVAQALKGNGSATLDGHEISLDDPVTLEIETESGKKGAELEFEIKWPAEKRNGKGRGKRFLLLAGVTGTAVGSAALLMAKKRRSSAEYEDAVV